MILTIFFNLDFISINSFTLGNKTLDSSVFFFSIFLSPLPVVFITFDIVVGLLIDNPLPFSPLPPLLIPLPPFPILILPIVLLKVHTDEQNIHF